MSRLDEEMGIHTSCQPDRIFDQTSLDFGMQGRHALIVKRDFSTDENVKNDAEAPYVDFGSGVGAGVEKLWSSKVEGTAESG